MGGEPDKPSSQTPLPSSRYISEFIGTYILVFSVGCNILASSSPWAVVSIAATLMVAIYAMGGISGGHFNPAVSFAVGLAGHLPWRDVAIYVGIQVLAGISAAGSYTVLLMETLPLSPGKGVAWWQAGLAEFFYTFMLAFVVLNTAISRKHAKVDEFYGLAIGFVVVAGGYAVGPLSGACLNPAVAIGIDVSSMHRGNFGWSLLYTLFELAGAALATALFKVVRPGDDPDQRPLYARLTSEFLGTFMLVLTVGLNVVNKSPAAAFSIAASLMCMIYALGSVSGAHFNPAVTFGIVLAGKMEGEEPTIDAMKYVGTQTAAGICAAFTYALLSGKTFQLEPQGSAGWYEAWLVELAFTFLLAFVVLSVATLKTHPLQQFFGLAIGSCITAGGFAAGGISGGSLNPAVSAGVAISSTVLGKSSLMHMVAYIISELCGGAVAAGAFYITRPDEVAPERTPLVSKSVEAA